MAKKHIPQRMCAICREQFPKRELIRLVRSAEGVVSLDDTGKKPGRGLYVCKSQACITQAMKGSRLEKATGAAVNEEIMNALREMVENGP